MGIVFVQIKFILSVKCADGKYVCIKFIGTLSVFCADSGCSFCQNYMYTCVFCADGVCSFCGLRPSTLKCTV